VIEFQRLPNGGPGLISLAPATLTEAEISEMHAVCAANPGYWQSSGNLDPDDISRDPVAAMLHGEAAAEGCELLAARDATGRLVGLAVVLPYNPGDGHPWIGLLLVDGRLHRRGHGRAIAAVIEERFRSEGQPAGWGSWRTTSRLSSSGPPSAAGRLIASLTSPRAARHWQCTKISAPGRLARPRRGAHGSR